MELDYAKQSLLRITEQKSDLEKNIASAYILTKGVVSVAAAAFNRDVTGLIDSMIEIYNEGNAIYERYKDNKQEQWFSTIRILKCLYYNNLQEFRDSYMNLFDSFAKREKQDEIIQNLNQIKLFQ